MKFFVKTKEFVVDHSFLKGTRTIRPKLHLKQNMPKFLKPESIF